MYAFSTSATTRHRSSSNAPNKSSASSINNALFSRSSSPSRSRIFRRRSSGTGGGKFPSAQSLYQLRSSTYITILKFVASVTILTLCLLLYIYEPHIELAFYHRGWVEREIESVPSLGGCFQEQRVSANYNLTDSLYGRRRTEVQAGMPLRRGLDCYDFAGTVRNDPNVPSTPYPPLLPAEKTQIHTYWRKDLAPFGPRQEWMLKSYFSTQNLATTRLVLWSNGDLSANPILQGYVNKYPGSFALQEVDITGLARGTELEGSPYLTSVEDKKAWVDGDLVRLLLLWSFGGVWVDMDSLLTRDLEPLFEHEFVTQWDCYGE